MGRRNKPVHPEPKCNFPAQNCTPARLSRPWRTLAPERKPEADPHAEAPGPKAPRPRVRPDADLPTGGDPAAAFVLSANSNYVCRKAGTGKDIFVTDMRRAMGWAKSKGLKPDGKQVCYGFVTSISKSDNSGVLRDMLLTFLDGDTAATLSMVSKMVVLTSIHIGPLPKECLSIEYQ